MDAHTSAEAILRGRIARLQRLLSELDDHDNELRTLVSAQARRILIMTREQALPYVAYCVDDALSEREIKDMPSDARLVGWQCGFEPMFVAVWSYLDLELDDQEAEELAVELLIERKWFSGRPTPADYVL
jgi:hypothetical protein